MRRRAITAAATLVLTVTSGCAPAPISPAPVSAEATGPASASRLPPDPVTVCTNQLTYWAGEELRGADAGYDYQEMGLTAAQNDALRTVVDRARNTGPAHVPEMAHEACAQLSTQPPSVSWGTYG